MADFDYDYESKLLHLEIKENEDKYISGEKSLKGTLDKTEALYEAAFKAAKESSGFKSSKFSHDSTLMQLQSKIVRQRAKSYKPDTLVFDPREFSEKLKRHFMGVAANEDKKKKPSNQQYSIIWQKLGEESQKTMHSVPTFDFLYGSFSAEPASPVKMKRKRAEKEKIKDAIKPKTVDMTQDGDKHDLMITRATKVLALLNKYLQKSEKKSVCFYEFVIDPDSFTRTIENIFSVTMLLKDGHVCIFPDEQGLPCLRDVTYDQRKEKKRDPTAGMQSVLSLSVQEWQAIIQKCNFTRALIPPPKAAQEKS